VDHSIFRTFNKGALGMLKVEGPEDKIIYSGKQSDAIYQPEGGAAQSVSEAGGAAPAARNMQERMAAGAIVYRTNCAACHQAQGQGMPNVFPPLANSDYIRNNEGAAIRAVARGLSGEITVNGSKYNGEMPALGLSDEEIANVVTYIRNSWGASGGETTPAEVAAARR
jgi:nitrite reductase (NO-forming)